MMVAMVAFCVLGLASVGLFYLPAAVALVTTVLGWQHAPSLPAVLNRDMAAVEAADSAQPSAT
jgi:hypothetical protein